MTIEIPDEDYRELKIRVAELGISIKNYVLDAIDLKKRVVIRDDGLVRVLNDETIKALEESIKNDGKRKSYSSVKDLINDLNANQ